MSEVLNASLPIILEDRTMALFFREFMFKVSRSLPTVGTGSPEGVLEAPYLSLYIDEGAGQGLISYRKMLPDISGDKSQGWEQLSVGSATWGGIGGSIASQVDLQAALDAIDTSQVTTGTFADARISATSVTQHEAALAILASQVSGYSAPLISTESATTYTMLVGDANVAKRMTGASPAVTIPTGTYAVGDVLTIRQAGTGTLVLTTTGLTVNGTIPTWAQHVETSFRYIATDTWDVI